MAEQQITTISEGSSDGPQSRQLYRSTTNRRVSGVCGGLAEYLGLDAGLVRVLWLVSLLITFGATALVYVLLAMLLPEESPEHAATKQVRSSDWWPRLRQNRVLLLGGILILAGVVLLFNSLGWLPWRLERLWNIVWSLFWPLLLIGLGVVLLLSLTGRGLDWSRVRQAGASLPFRRSRQDRVIAGVCGGLAAYLGVDSMLVRAGWLLLTVLTAGTIGVLLYVVAVLLVPWEDEA